MLFAAVALVGCFSTGSTSASSLTGTWVLDTARSDEVAAWRNLELVVASDGDAVTLTRNLGWGRRRFSDSITVTPGSGTSVLPLVWWADIRHIGVYAVDGAERTVEAVYLDDGRTLRTEARFMVETQQGVAPMRITTEFRLWPDGDRLTMIEIRSSRPTPITYAFVRKP
jgi:hypothetical protein